MGFFDPLSFAIGAGVGAGVGGGAAYYVLKKRLKRPVAEGEEGVEEEGLREVLSPQAGKRYNQEMIAYFQQMHLGGKQVKLTDVLIEPRLLRPAGPPLIIEEDDEGVLKETNIYRVIPFLHDFPSMYAAFNLETISYTDLESGDRQIAILGVPGSGKTTLLAILGLSALGHLTAENLKTEDTTPRGVYQIDPTLPKEVQERRIKEREEVQKQAIAQLRVIQKREGEMAVVEKRDLALDIDQLFPIYVHVRHLDLNPETYGGMIDPAEPIGKALPNYVKNTTAIISTPLLYKMMRNGEALILIDGFDDLAPAEQEIYLHWLKALAEHYGNNFIVVTGPATGYDGLIHAGYAHTFMAPLNERRIQLLIEKWMTSGTALGTLSTDQQKRLVVTDNRNRTVLDICMKIWAALSGEIKQTGRRGYYDSYIRHHISNIPFASEILQDSAAYWLDNGKLATGDAMQAIMAKYLGGSVAPPDDSAEGDKKGKKKAAPPSSKADSTFKQIANAPIVLATPDGGLTLNHPTLNWYLVSETLKDAPPEKLASLGHNPLWDGAFSFATALVDLSPPVLERLKNISTNPDLLFSQIFAVAHWMPDAPSGIRWKAEILKRLRGVILAPSQYPTVREYAMAAMVTSRDEGASYIFREAVRSANADIRRLGCLGLGAMGSGDYVGDLVPMLVDETEEVQLAAGLALGAIGNEAALDALAEALLTGEEGLRKAVAEALAAVPGIGYETLVEGITADDMYVRRASTFGLARIPETWALVSLYRAMLEDSQWYVRAAAEIAFSQAREPRRAGPMLFPEPADYQWLAEWAATRGVAVPEGVHGRQLLMQALQEAPHKVRVEAARTLGKLGHPPAVKALYSMLMDREPEMRTTAFTALGEMSARFGKPLPGLA